MLYSKYFLLKFKNINNIVKVMCASVCGGMTEICNHRTYIRINYITLSIEQKGGST